jgi:peptidoglycan hydrolase CwlO-like protein
MSTVTDNDLKELKDLINSKFEQLDRKFEKVFEEFTDVKVEIATLKEGQNSLNSRLNETKEALSKRLDNLEFIARSVIGGILVALLLGLTKLLYPNLLG